MEKMAGAFFQKKIHFEKTLGEKLRCLRKKKKASLEQVEEGTKVRLKYLEAFENGNFDSLPADVYAIGFLAKYADFLETSKDELISDFRKERIAQRQINPIPVKLSKKNKIFITPRILTIAATILICAGLVFYIFYSIRHFISAPNLEIALPSTDTVIRQDSVEVVGKTDQGSSLQINDQTIFIDGNGNFHEAIRLQPGINTIEIRSTNRIKKQTVKVVKVFAEF